MLCRGNLTENPFLLNCTRKLKEHFNIPFSGGIFKCGSRNQDTFEAHYVLNTERMWTIPLIEKTSLGVEQWCHVVQRALGSVRWQSRLMTPKTRARTRTGPERCCEREGYRDRRPAGQTAQKWLIEIHRFQSEEKQMSREVERGTRSGMMGNNLYHHYYY